MDILKWLKPSTWLEGIIAKKVVGKFAKHAAGALTAFISGGWFAKEVIPWADKLLPYLAQVGINVNLDFTKFEDGAVVLFAGAFGALWNYIEHRFFKS